MERKKTFEPGQPVKAISGQMGLVIGRDTYGRIKNRLREGRRPGHYFAPGCCANPDYVTQVPVVFEDGSYDVMRSIQIRKESYIPHEKKEHITDIIKAHDRD